MKVGDKVIIRGVVFHYIGEVEAIDEDEITLKNASWLAESERWTETLETGKVRELEIFPYGCTLKQESICDYSPWIHPLPTESV